MNKNRDFNTIINGKQTDSPFHEDVLSNKFKLNKEYDFSNPEIVKKAKEYYNIKE